MYSQTSCLDILKRFIGAEQNGLHPLIGKPEIFAHATLSALAHHYPNNVSPEILEILAKTERIANAERPRWDAQKRIAFAQIASAAPHTPRDG